MQNCCLNMNKPFCLLKIRHLVFEIFHAVCYEGNKLCTMIRMKTANIMETVVCNVKSWK